MNIWSSRLDGGRVLDLFAGSGAVGFEALSRGAGCLVLADNNRAILGELERACDRFGAPQAVVVQADLPADLEKIGRTVCREFDLIFADPPYDFTAYRELLESVAPLLAAAGELAVEHAAALELPERAGDLWRWAQRRYGDSRLTFYHHAGQERR